MPRGRGKGEFFKIHLYESNIRSQDISARSKVRVAVTSFNGREEALERVRKRGQEKVKKREQEKVKKRAGN